MNLAENFVCRRAVCRLIEPLKLPGRRFVHCRCTKERESLLGIVATLIVGGRRLKGMDTRRCFPRIMLLV